jgi:DNA-binding Lrp family transcriptional regulator
MGKELGLSGTAVQKRVHEMVEEGVIRSFEIGFDSTMLGLQTSIVDVSLRGSYKLNDILRQFRKIPNVYFVICGLDKTLTVLIHYRTNHDLEKLLERIGAIEHVVRVQPGIPRSLPETDIQLGKMDWKLIQQLNHDARKRNHEIAEELGVSAKTVKRRLDRLVKHKAIYFTIDVDLSKAVKMIMYVLIVDLEPGLQKKNVYKRILNTYDKIWASVGPVQPSIVYFLGAETLAEIETVVEDAKRIQGVKNATAALYTSFHRFPEWYDKQLAKMAR